MILTGKALEDFLEWYDESGFFVDLEYDLVQYALIIEWLDSVGIYVSVIRKGNGWGFNIDCKTENRTYGTLPYRRHTTKHAIMTANEIYNKL